MLLSIGLLDRAQIRYTVVSNLKLLEIINQLEALRKEKWKLKFYNKASNQLIQLTLILFQEALILCRVNLLSLKPMEPQSKVNSLKIRWNLSLMELKLNMTNKVFPTWVKKNCNQKFWMKLLRIEEILERKLILFKKSRKKFKSHKIMIK